MDKYINEETIIKNETYGLFKDLILCKKCQNLLIEPSICTNCLNQYCKNCIDKNKCKEITCPNCQQSNFNEINENNRMIKKFKFKCIKGCGEELLYDEIENHYKNNCLTNKKNTERKFAILTKEQVAEIKKKTKQEIKYLTSK